MAKGSLNAGKKVFLVHGKRTPFGRFGGSLKDIAPVDLAVHSAKSAIADLKLDPNAFDQVILGNVAPSTTDTMYGGRHLALKLGMSESTPGHLVNRLCGSGIQAILDSVRLIKLGEAEIVLAAGAENMSLMPHLVYGSRFGTKYGPLRTVDMLTDTLLDKFTGIPMALTAEKLAETHRVSREDCDLFSYRSHQKTAKAYQENLLQGEIAPIELKTGLCDKDEHVRFDVELEEMRGLKANFKTNGVVTAASASGVVDGACSIIVASEEAVKTRGLSPLAEIIDGHVVGVDPGAMGIGPVPAVQALLKKNGLNMDDIDSFEINEAFAAQVMACSKELGIPDEKLNRWGGAVSIGHPLGATGARISLTLARQLAHYQMRYGVASACIGGGQGISLLLKRV